jgi:hypothetical protein
MRFLDSVGDHDRITIMINFLKLDHDRNRSWSKWIMIGSDHDQVFFFWSWSVSIMIQMIMIFDPFDRKYDILYTIII